MIYLPLLRLFTQKADRKLNKYFFQSHRITFLEITKIFTQRKMQYIVQKNSKYNHACCHPTTHISHLEN